MLGVSPRLTFCYTFERMRIFAVSVFALGLYAQPAASPYAPLWDYAGTWQITAANAAPGIKPETLVNQCAELGKFFACGQTINGEAEGMVVFVTSGNTPGQYKTQTIRPDGRATGVVQLEVKGNQWTYTSRRDEYGKTTYYKNTNTFTAKNRIHYEQAVSQNGAQWSVTGSGEEVRVGGAVRGTR